MQDKNPKNGTISHRTLNGMRILDFSWVLAGPYASRILADFGAEVIKVQPQLAEADDAFSRGYYSTWNRNKLSITLNLDTPEGMNIVRRLISLSDVVVENFSPRVMDNLGVGIFSITKNSSGPYLPAHVRRRSQRPRAKL